MVEFWWSVPYPFHSIKLITLSFYCSGFKKRLLNYLCANFAYAQQVFIKIISEFHSQRYIKCILIKSFIGIWDRHSCLYNKIVLCLELSFSKKPSLGGLRLSPLKSLWNVNSLKARLRHLKSALILSSPN